MSELRTLLTGISFSEQPQSTSTATDSRQRPGIDP
jgi:hypothetical protein